ncbi:lipopolysaccharide biosynthesis protein [Methylocystis sp. JAN1]|uniref:lipopolysaccharide biosynthesis protein n=1 Tax=Methylocystis sp. JAN1 TaxID=3397211 RepID=UPI003FA25527
MTLSFKSLAAILAGREAAIAAVLALGIKAAGALLTLAVFTLAARAMSPDEFGRLAIWFNAVSFLAVAACFGQDTLIARSFGEYASKGDRSQAWGAYRYGWTMTIASGVVFAGAMLFLAPFFFPQLVRTALLAGAFFLLTQTLLHYSSHSTRVIVNFFVSEVSRELIWRIALLIAVIWAVLHQGLTPTEFFFAAGVGQILSLVAALHHVRKSYLAHSVDSLSQQDRKHWLSRGLAMWQSATVEAGSAYFDVILIGYVASPADAGDYFAAARIANVFIMVLTGLNTYSMSHSASLHFSGQTRKLQDILRALVSVSTVMLAPLLALIYVFGREILTIFGERFASVYPTLVVLATACFVMSSCGSASVILLTTGHERIYSRIITAATLGRFTLTAILAHFYGSLGAACAFALVNAPLFIALSVICKRAIGADTSIMSVFAYLWERRKKSANPAGEIASQTEPQAR